MGHALMIFTTGLTSHGKSLASECFHMLGFECY